MGITSSASKDSKPITLRNKIKSKSLSKSITQSETFLLKLFDTRMLEFLTLKDFTFSVQLLNSRFYFIFDEQPHILNHFVKKYYLEKDEPNIPLNKFFKKQLEKVNTVHDISAYQELHATVLKKIQLNKNMVKNHSGKHQLNHWKIEANGGNGWAIEDFFTQLPRKSCFVTSYGWDIMSQTIKIDDFDSNAQELLKSGNALIKAGCYIAKRWDCPSEGYFEVEINKGMRQLFKQKVYKDNDSIPRGQGNYSPYVLISITYDIDPNELPDTIKVIIGGKDLNWWRGHYGTRFSNIFVICDLKNIEIKQ